MRGITLLLLAICLPLPLLASPYVGSDACTACHQQEASSWRGSHHDLAMAEANEASVLGDFNGATLTAHGVTSRFHRKDGRYHVHTDGPDGKMHDYPIRYTFGWYPLQQYLIEMPNGHVQSLGLAWDSRTKEAGGQRWFHLYPDEKMDHNHPLHWTSRDQNWNYQCAECHSTNLKKNYDLETDSFDTTWSEIDVACEACHGPGEQHVNWARQARQGKAKAEPSNKGLAIALNKHNRSAWTIDPESGKPKRLGKASNEVQLCARCHSRRGQVWDDYEFGKPLDNTHRLALLEEHLYFPDGQIKDEVYVHGSFIQSRMYHAGVTCSDCHDAHSLKRHAEGNALCTRCHLVSKYDVPDHHHHKAGSKGAACTACHMPQRTYMVIDERADHSLRVPRPDLSATLGTPNVCNDCHADKDVQWAVQAVADWYPDSRYRSQHFGMALNAARKGNPNAERQLTALILDESQPAIARATALSHLRDYADARHLGMLEKLLVDHNSLIRAAAVNFLEVTDLRTRIDQGWPALSDESRAVRLEAARIMAPVMRQRLPEKFKQQLVQVLDEYEQAQRVNAERPESHLNLGLIAVEQGDLARAEKAYLLALRLDPAFVPASVNLADLYRQQRRDADGENVLREAIQRVPDSADLNYSLGLLLVRARQAVKSLAYLKRGYELAPDNTQYAYVYAVALDSVGQVRSALLVLQAVHIRDQDDLRILLALMEYSKKQGDHEAALRYARRLRQIAPNNAQIRQVTDAVEAELTGAR